MAFSTRKKKMTSFEKFMHFLISDKGLQCTSCFTFFLRSSIEIKVK